MLRLRDGQGELFDALMPAEAKALSAELASIDLLLDDDRFLAPFVARFNCPIGRPTIPMETYLRLMYLKHRYSLGYETLVKEVADSISWRRFCRIGLTASVPHSTTVLKLTRRFGTEIIEELNREVLKAAVERKLLRSRRLRTDCTVMEADIKYPTDSGLSSHAISRLSQAVAKVKSLGMAIRTRFRNRSRTAAKVAHRISRGLGRPGSKEIVLRETGALGRLAGGVVRQARRVLGNARQRIPKKRRKAAMAAVKQLGVEVERAARVVTQSVRRAAGESVIPDRLISLCDPDARPIRRGKLRTPTEFGYKVAVADTPEGFVVGHEVQGGNPHDADTLPAMLVQAKAIGMRVRTVFGDRGYGNELADRALADAGINDKVIPRVGRAAPIESTRSWRRRYRWRAGAEGRISYLKRRFGWARTRLEGHTGARLWAGYGILASNLDRMVALAG
jgi:IS5 family transposase